MAALFGIETSKNGDAKFVHADRNSDLDFEIERIAETSARSSDSEQTSPIKELEKLDVEHVPESHRKRIRDILRELPPMWDGSLGTLVITEHRTNLVPNTGPLAQHHYRSGARAREEENSQAEKILRAGVIQPF